MNGPKSVYEWDQRQRLIRVTDYNASNNVTQRTEYRYLCLSQLSPACFFMVVRSGVRANIPRASLQLARIWREVRSVRLRCDQRGRVVRGLEAVSRHATSFALVG